MFLTLVYLKNKKPKKKKKKPTFIYKVKLKPWIMERGEMDGDGAGLGQSRYHVLKPGEPEESAGCCWRVWALVTQPPAERAGTDSAVGQGGPFPKNLLLSPSRLCAVQEGALIPCQTPLVSSVYWHQILGHIEKPFPPLSYSKLEEDRRKHKTKGPGRNPKVEGRAVLEGCRCWT